MRYLVKMYEQLLHIKLLRSTGGHHIPLSRRGYMPRV
jgi:hypothetical protein